MTISSPSRGDQVSMMDGVGMDIAESSEELAALTEAVAAVETSSLELAVDESDDDTDGRSLSPFLSVFSFMIAIG